MLTPTTILFPTDGSPAAERARPYAVRLAERSRATLHVLRVEPDLAAGAEGATAAGAPSEDVGPGGGRYVEAVRHAPEAGSAILRYAAEVRAELIVMGTHGRSGLGRVLLGSTAEHVLRRAGCPVLLVSTEAHAPAGERVVVAYDFSETADHTLAVAAALAEEAGEGLDVLHVVEDASVPSPFGPVTAPPADAPALAQRAEAALRERVRAYDEGPTPVALHVASGNAVQEIVRHAREAHAGLLVMGSRGRRGLARALMGSVAEGVVRQAPCPVLVVKAGLEPQP
jgi:nucleotide-binding universal stress UspA family protein